MSIKQPRRPSTPARRRRGVAGQRRPVPAGGPVPLEAAEPVPTSAPVGQPDDRPDDGVELPETIEIVLAPRRRGPRWLWPLAAVTVAAVAFGAVATLDRVRADAAADDQQAAEEAAASAASSAAEDILGYSYTSVEEDLAAAQKRMTPEFAKEFADVVPTVTSLAEQRQLVVTAQVRSAAVLECGEDCSPTEVRVLLFVDQSRTGEGRAMDAIAVRTVFTMIRTDGRWLVGDSVSL